MKIRQKNSRGKEEKTKTPTIHRLLTGFGAYVQTWFQSNNQTWSNQTKVVDLQRTKKKKLGRR
ncbi:MAG: hypothetical protein ACJAVI_002816 [Candidatus Azotimanducaceae bacterium]|jgi:hypothetical protein